MPKKSQAFHEFMPEQVWKWKLMEERFDHVLKLHDYHEIRLSVLQDFEVLQKGIQTLMVGSEAERVAERTLNLCQPDGNLSLLSLRPEGTISVLQHTARSHKKGEIHRYYYHGPMFRKARDGSAIESFQLGVELLGSDSIFSENEVISLGIRLLRDLGFREASLRLNSYGCDSCRRKFFTDVCAFLEKHRDEFCDNCYEELCANPFADTRCESKSCRHDAWEGPEIGAYLCKKCQANFSQIKKIQANLGHSYKVDPRLFKNFAYYNETVFDFVVAPSGKETSVGGGGRYDYLSERINGRKLPAVGFYLDLDELFRLMESRGLFLPSGEDFAVYLCAQSPDMDMMLLQIAQELHGQNIKTVLSTEISSTEAELKNARSARCHLMIAIREENIREGKLLLHNLGREDQAYIALNRLAESIGIARKSLKK
ncbi:MAG: ATP phosphoribosyltransferase regulatory subunit [Candidatus Syntrophosphaera sp.]|nr:ATP phosphoribosyltransferase regulatory subunit [Candidatus Syntrophosphaera sp.]